MSNKCLSIKSLMLPCLQALSKNKSDEPKKEPKAEAKDEDDDNMAVD